MKIVVINGHPGAGKDEFVRQCQQCSKNTSTLITNVSTVDFVKFLAAKCGWDGTKTPKNRAFLSDLKDLLTQWDDVPYKKVCQDIALQCARWTSYGLDTSHAVAFVHCREPKEIQKFVERNNAITLCIRRAAVDNNQQSNHADAEIDQYTYDYYIDNDGSLTDLQNTAREFLKEIFTDSE